MIQTFTKPRNILEIDWFKRYGKVYGVFGMDTSPVLTCGDPELIKQIMVKDFHLFRNRRGMTGTTTVFQRNLFRAVDDSWKRLRSIMSPTFTSKKMKNMYELIRECSKEYEASFDFYAQSGKEANMKTLHGNFTMDVIAKCAFATKTNSHKDQNDPFVKNAKEIFNFKIWRLLLVEFFPKWFLQLVGISSFSSEAGFDFFAKTTKQIIRRRRENKEKHNDFLQLLMDAVKDDYDHEIANGINGNAKVEVEDSVAHHVNEGKEEIEAEKRELDINLTNKKLDEDEIVAQVR